jgi:prepilin-type N-terminal cleavage/methylation domain-containing protein
MMIIPTDIKIGLGTGTRLRPPALDRAGFTLTELLAVMTIIGILLTFILKASMDGVRRANELATQGLIQKLDEAMSERMEALMTVDIYPNNTHNVMAATYSSSGTPKFDSPDRARVIALYDFIKAEVPDVFFPSGDANYPLNFAGQPFPHTEDPRALYNSLYASYMLPLGAGIDSVNQYGSLNTIYGSYDPTAPNGTGIFGASYAAAAGIYKNLGYHPTGYDGVDNNQNGLIDELAEGVDAANSALVTANLANHTHKTARSEMLYALLVEGMGPLGSAFAPDDFTSREVADTDNDGLPEFIDAWGEPLQFYRWPIFYHSDIQRGFPNAGAGGPYYSVFEDREQNPLDPNQLLVSPSWMLEGTNESSGLQPYFNSDPSSVMRNVGGKKGDARLSNGAWAFQYFFHTLVEPQSALGYSSVPASLWDRSNISGNFPDYSLRRAYFTKFLILSSGPDQALGVGMLGVDYGSGVTGSVFNYGTPLPSQLRPSPPPYQVKSLIQNLIQIENTAAAIDPKQWNGPMEVPNINSSPTATGTANAVTLYLQQNAGADDISNHNTRGTAGGQP